jgi:hypothetical protein
VDISIFDQFSRPEERSKEISRANKVLSKILPAKVTMVPPPGDAELARWRKQIERDTEQLKLEANHFTLRRVLERNSMTADALPETKVCVRSLSLSLSLYIFYLVTCVHAVSSRVTQVLKEQVLSNEQAEKVVGWALSHRLMASDEPPPLRGERLLLTAEDFVAGLEMLAASPDQPSVRSPLTSSSVESGFALIADAWTGAHAAAEGDRDGERVREASPLRSDPSQRTERPLRRHWRARKREGDPAGASCCALASSPEIDFRSSHVRRRWSCCRCNGPNSSARAISPSRARYVRFCFLSISCEMWYVM